MSCAEVVITGPVAAGELVLALRARLDPLEAAGDGKVDRLVVADLEMQEGVVLDAAPVAAVEPPVADEVDGAGDVAAAAASPSRAGSGRAIRSPMSEKKRRLR